MRPRLEPSSNWTYREYCLIPEDGLRHEVLGGEHFVNPAPETYHQTVSRRIMFQLYRQVEETGLGEVYNAPTDVELSPQDIVQPDILVVLAAQKGIITRSHVIGTPDLVIEILSPSNPEHDRVRKRSAYERTGVPEYWIVDPAAHTLEPLVLEEGRYRSLGPRADTAEFRGCPGVSVDLAKVW